jgi:predicted nuclease of predicted toxin-antitoxin system
LRLLLDEMYPAALADALRVLDIDASTVVELGLGGSSDPEVFAAAVAEGYTLLTENVADFAHVSAEHLTAGRHHHGVLIALSSRVSCRPAGIGVLVIAICAAVDQELEDRLVYLQAPERAPRGTAS